MTDVYRRLALGTEVAKAPAGGARDLKGATGPVDPGPPHLVFARAPALRLWRTPQCTPPASPQAASSI